MIGVLFSSTSMRTITLDNGISVSVFKSSTGGLGMLTNTPLKKGTQIIEYVGPILTNAQAEEKCGRYLFQISARKTIDGSGRSNIARYINHSCRPNCEIEIVKGRVFVYAMRAIKAGEELCYDYGEEYFDHFIKPHGCLCLKCTEARTRTPKDTTSSLDHETVATPQ